MCFWLTKDVVSGYNNNDYRKGEDRIVRCPNCGAKNPDWSTIYAPDVVRFCVGCGAELPKPSQGDTPDVSSAQPVSRSDNSNGFYMPNNMNAGAALTGGTDASPAPPVPAAATPDLPPADPTPSRNSELVSVRIKVYCDGRLTKSFSVSVPRDCSSLEVYKAALRSPDMENAWHGKAIEAGVFKINESLTIRMRTPKSAKSPVQKNAPVQKPKTRTTATVSRPETRRPERGILSHSLTKPDKSKLDASKNKPEGTTPEFPIKLLLSRSEAKSGGVKWVSGDDWGEKVEFPAWVRDGELMCFQRKTGKTCWVVIDVTSLSFYSPVVVFFWAAFLILMAASQFGYPAIEIVSKWWPFMLLIVIGISLMNNRIISLSYNFRARRHRPLPEDEP